MIKKQSGTSKPCKTWTASFLIGENAESVVGKSNLEHWHSSQETSTNDKSALGLLRNTQRLDHDQQWLWIFEILGVYQVNTLSDQARCED